MILIQNIYYMLSYAFKALKNEGYKNVQTEQFDNVKELLSEILILGLNIEIKRGLFRNYEDKTDSISTIKGQLNISDSIKNQTFINGKMVCNFDEFTENTYLNQILKTTLLLLLHSKISKHRAKKIKSLLFYFNNVDMLDYKSIKWKVSYNKNNQNYKMLIAICNLIIKGMIQSNSKGITKLMDFIDEQRMSSLYEKFILEYFKQEHPDVNASSEFINWQLDDDFDMFLPNMKSDITLSLPDKVLIIDAKYYADNMQHYYEKDKIVSANIYQVFTYVKNKSYELKNDKTVSGMLLYAKTENEMQPNADYRMSGNLISVRTLDLNNHFSLIKEQLEKIYNNFIE